MSDISGPFDFANKPKNLLQVKAKALPREIFIEVGDSKKKANVIRDKVAIPVVEIDKNILDDFVLRRPKIVNKVVSQSIAPGTVVSEGASIDLVIAPSRTVPGNLFTKGHLFMKDQLLLDVFSQFVADNTNVKRLLAQRPDPEDLSAADIEFLTQVAVERGIEIEQTPGKTAQDLFVSLQIANTFIG